MMKKLFLVLSLLFVGSSLIASDESTVPSVAHVTQEMVEKDWNENKVGKQTVSISDALTAEIIKKKDADRYFFKIDLPILGTRFLAGSEKDFKDLITFAQENPNNKIGIWSKMNPLRILEFDELYSCVKVDRGNNEQIDGDFSADKIMQEAASSQILTDRLRTNAATTAAGPVRNIPESPAVKELKDLFNSSARAEIAVRDLFAGLGGSNETKQVSGRLLESKSSNTAYFLPDDGSDIVTEASKISGFWAKKSGTTSLNQLKGKKGDLQKVASDHKFWPLVWASLSGIVSVAEFTTAIHDLVKRSKLAAKLKRYEEKYGVDSNRVAKLRKARSGMVTSAIINSVVGVIAAGIGVWQFKRGWRKGIIDIK